MGTAQTETTFNWAITCLKIFCFNNQVKVSRSDDNQLTHEDRRNNLSIEVTQRKNTNIWSMWNSGDQETDDVQILNYTVPQNGILKIEFPILYNSSELYLKVQSLSMPQQWHYCYRNFVGDTSSEFTGHRKWTHICFRHRESVRSHFPQWLKIHLRCFLVISF